MKLHEDGSESRSAHCCAPVGGMTSSCPCEETVHMVTSVKDMLPLRMIRRAYIDSRKSSRKHVSSSTSMHYPAITMIQLLLKAPEHFIRIRDSSVRTLPRTSRLGSSHEFVRTSDRAANSGARPAGCSCGTQVCATPSIIRKATDTVQTTHS
jgi:hypothetical protein